INLVDGQGSRCFQSFFRLPALEIRAENEKFSADLDDTNALFFNDSAEMPYGEARQFRSIRNIEKRFLHHQSLGRLHKVPSLSDGKDARSLPKGTYWRLQIAGCFNSDLKYSNLRFATSNSFFRHEGIPVIRRRHEVFFDGAGTDPPQQV